jgi:pimeloyl-ACP methyl ester carboxylesterase
MFETPRSTRSRSLPIVALAMLAAVATPIAAQTNEAPVTTTSSAAPTAVRTGHVQANGVRYYYEIHGQGEPLLLLHGGLGSTGMFAPVLPALTANRQVIAVDLHGHGRTALGDRPISLVDMGDDMATLVSELGYAQVDVLGYSMGGGVGFRFAVQHPGKVRRLAMVSAGFAQDGFHPEMLPMQAQVGAAMADAMKETPMYQGYAAVAPNPADFPRLLDRMGELMRTPYDWAEDVKRLSMPTMIVFGDSDMYRPEHVVEMYRLLGGGQRDAGWMREHQSKNRLAILPDVTHYDIFLSPALPATVLPFLDGKSAAATWAAQTAQQQD